MKKLLPALFLLSTLTIALTSCKKDDTCHVRINVVNAQGQKQHYIWVRMDIAPGTPPGNYTDRVPVQLNTMLDGYVEADFKLPAIFSATAYDSTNTLFTPPALGEKIIKLVPGETVTETITIP